VANFLTASSPVQLGYVSGVHGLQGWVKVFSYTEPRDNMLTYASWLVGSDGQLRKFEVENSRWNGKLMAAKLAGIHNRDESAELVGYGIFVDRVDLPELHDNEFYWADLIGLEVLTEDGVCFGRIEQLMETGANDVLVVRGDRERLIPFIQREVIKQVDLEQGRLIVDWVPDF
jgi:16S rRNA processing protein RimM